MEDKLQQLIEAVEEILQLREWKITHGKDAHYETNKPIAWNNLLEAYTKAKELAAYNNNINGQKWAVVHKDKIFNTEQEMADECAGHELSLPEYKIVKIIP
jgi:hypothetical protein